MHILISNLKFNTFEIHYFVPVFKIKSILINLILFEIFPYHLQLNEGE